MFHGGTNPDGKLTTLQETQAIDHWQDLPVKAYDYQAPLGEYGQMHASFRDLKNIHLFLRDFGSTLAPMAAYFPMQTPASKQDRETPRVGVRSDSKAGFIFLSNYQKDHPLPVQKAVQVEMKLASGTVNVPQHPVDIPAGTYTFWPVNLPVGPAVLAHATVQPLCRLDDPDTMLFFAWPGIVPEFVFDSAADVTITAPHGHVKRVGEQTVVWGIVPGLSAAIEIAGKDGRHTQVLLLSREQARDIWKAPLGGRDRLIYSPADVYFEGDKVHLHSTDAANLKFGVFPDLDREAAGFHRVAAEGIFKSYAAAVTPVHVEAEVRQVRDAGKVAAVRMGKEVALAPEESAFEGAARWSIHVPDVKSPDVGQILLRISYQGDVARIYAGGRMLTDDFYHGTPWDVGLRDIPAADLKQGLELQILPLRADAPIYLASDAKPSIPAGGQIARVTEVHVLPEYQAVANLRP
jgi:hypothetical protein